MTIAAILQGRSADVFTCAADTRVDAVVQMLAEHRIGAMPVLADGAVAGIVSERDILYRLHERGAAMLDQRAADVMTAPAITITPDVAVVAALSLMTRRRIRHLPVIDGGRMIGFISIGDLVKHRIDRIEADAEAMRTYIQSA